MTTKDRKERKQMKEGNWDALWEHYKDDPCFRHEFDNDEEFREFVILLTNATDEQRREVRRILEQEREGR